ncbi:SNF2 family N-terminal domain-containing protein [Tricladium varicosporioides]|nr:SNF2 family N-terminal domain-containing protein [Hymenoscyphus varicosporioides]
MAHHPEDQEWMEDGPESEESVDIELNDLMNMRDMLEKRIKNGKITKSERIRLYKVQARISTKQRVFAAKQGDRRDQTPEEEESLFVQDSQEDIVRRHREELEFQREARAGPGNSSGISGVDGVPITKAGRSRKRVNTGAGAKGKRPADAREYFSQEADRRTRGRGKAQKKSGQPVGSRKKPKARGKGKAKAKEKGEKDDKGKGKEKKSNGDDNLMRGWGAKNGADDIGRMILEDLMSNDPINDRLQNPIFDVESEPVIEGQLVKTDQFKRLFANIPAGTSHQTFKSDQKKIKEASKSFGYAGVRAIDGKWLVRGMNSTLYHHQLLGAQWMVARELSSEPPHGGLLADSMGLGKTVQTLACMVGNPPSPEDLSRKVRATLIVVPAAVVDQWYDEIKIHAGKKFKKILKYKSSSHIPVELLEDLDVVITTYNEVMRQFPFPDKQGRELIGQIGYKMWWKQAVEDLGDLHQVNWYRVVLDEAHAIKNNSGRTSLACQNLKAAFRWCLTGTPLLNRFEELFPYLRFLRANYAMNWDTFRKFFCDPSSPECHSRIVTLLSYTMMRRTMKTTLLNRPIIILPPPHPHLQYLHFSPEEQLIYRITENRFRTTLNTFIAKGDVRRNYGVFMVQLLRLRQCTSHPFMLERTIKECWTMEDVTELKSKLERLKVAHGMKPFYQQTQLWVAEGTKRREKLAEAFTAAGVRIGEHHGSGVCKEGRPAGTNLDNGKGISAMGENNEESSAIGPTNGSSALSVDFVSELMPFGQGTFGESFNIDKALETLNEKDMWDRTVCGICEDVPEEGIITDCGHVFCHDCLESHLHDRALEGDEYFMCIVCSRIFESTRPLRNPHLDDDEFSQSSPSRSRGRKHKSKSSRKPKVHEGSKGRDMMGFEPYTPDATWLIQSDTVEGFDLPPSAKTTALKALLLKGFQEAPLDKVVIYVQFRLLARIIGRICAGEKWGFLYLSGDCSLEHRSKAVKMFRDNPDIQIMIAGLKCGGLGLNFPWANRCISLDLWWNHAVEQQAFGRIFRIGQKKETHMTRLVIKNTVDFRLLSMQLHKLKHLEKVVDGEGGEGKKGLSMRQLANLFGFLRADKNGELIGVEADYEDEESGNAEGSSNPFVEIESGVDEDEEMGDGGKEGYGERGANCNGEEGEEMEVD